MNDFQRSVGGLGAMKMEMARLKLMPMGGKPLVESYHPALIISSTDKKPLTQKIVL